MMKWSAAPRAAEIPAELAVARTSGGAWLAALMPPSPALDSGHAVATPDTRKAFCRSSRGQRATTRTIIENRAYPYSLVSRAVLKRQRSPTSDWRLWREADVPEFSVSGNELYLSPVKDLFNGEIARCGVRASSDGCSAIT